jgi:hypothetical protein
MRADEEFCKDCLDGYLRRRLGLATRWRLGTEPPDYFLTVHGTTFAVEVTQLFGQVSTDAGESMGDEQYDASMATLCERIRRSVMAEGVLHGFYLVQFVGPFQHFRRTRSLIIAGVLEYIRSTQGATTAPGRVVFSEIGLEMKGRGFTPEMIAEFVGGRWIPQSCSIAKLGPRPDRIECVTSARSRFMWEGQVQAEACLMLQEAVALKERKLAAVEEPIILIVLHQWPMVGAGIYSGCTDGLNLPSSYHSVFVVQSAEVSYFLHTDEADWSNHQG